ncbi:MAG: helix-turn-helix domain-containing protein [Methylocella sp.]
MAERKGHRACVNKTHSRTAWDGPYGSQIGSAERTPDTIIVGVLGFFAIPRLIDEPREISCGFHDSVWLRQRRRSDGAFTVLARDGSSPCPVTRRANAVALLDDGWSCQQAAHALLLDDGAIRGWRKLFEHRDWRVF